MKQKNSSVDAVTKEDLVDALREFRVEIREEFKASEERIVSSERNILANVGIKLAEMELRIDDRARAYNSEILTRFDHWAGTFDNVSTDQTVTNNQVSKLRKTVDRHEKRITKLEHN
jgi:hypothetical protein